MLREWIKNLDDVRAFGPGILARHSARLRRDKLVSVDTPVGPIHFRADKSDLDTLRQVFVGRQYDIHEQSLSLVRLRARYDAILAGGQAPVIVDAGANIGAAALWFHARYPKANIVAIEPEPDNFAILEKNVAGRPGFTPLHAAIGAVSGFAAIEQDTAQSWARTQRAEAGIPIVTVDQAVAAVPNGELFIVKIDIEGFEADLFSQNVDWVERAYAITIEPHDWMFSGRHTSANFQRVMSRHDFEVFLAGDNLIYVRV